MRRFWPSSVWTGESPGVTEQTSQGMGQCSVLGPSPAGPACTGPGLLHLSPLRSHLSRPLCPRAPGAAAAAGGSRQCPSPPGSSVLQPRGVSSLARGHRALRPLLLRWCCSLCWRLLIFPVTRPLPRAFRTHLEHSLLEETFPLFLQDRPSPVVRCHNAMYFFNCYKVGHLVLRCTGGMLCVSWHPASCLLSPGSRLLPREDGVVQRCREHAYSHALRVSGFQRAN